MHTHAGSFGGLHLEISPWWGWSVLCASFVVLTLKAVVRHIGVVHARDPGFHIKCGIQDCIRTYKNYFKKHVYRHHIDQFNPVHPDPCHISTEEGSIPLEMSCGDDTGFNFNSDDSEAGYDHTEQAALFVLKAKHVHKISQLALNDLLFDVSATISDRVQFVKCLGSISTSSNRESISWAYYSLSSTQTSWKFWIAGINLICLKTWAEGYYKINVTCIYRNLLRRWS